MAVSVDILKLVFQVNNINLVLEILKENLLKVKTVWIVLMDYKLLEFLNNYIIY